jgi:hypothetical protein
VTKVEALEIIAQVRRSPLYQAEKDTLLETLLMLCSGNRRRMQNYCAWINFGTEMFWSELAKYPLLATNIIASHLRSRLNLACPSEGTCASIAAVALLAQFGPMVCACPQSCVDKAYKDAKQATQNKNLHPEPYIELLPPTPAELMRQYPGVARQAFSATRLPVSFPMSDSAYKAALSRINQRGLAFAPTAANAMAMFASTSLQQQFLQLMSPPAPKHKPPECPLTIFPPHGQPASQSPWLNGPPTILSSPSKLKALEDSPSKLMPLADGHTESAATKVEKAAPEAEPKIAAASAALQVEINILLRYNCGVNRIYLCMRILAVSTAFR